MKHWKLRYLKLQQTAGSPFEMLFGVDEGIKLPENSHCMRVMKLYGPTPMTRPRKKIRKVKLTRTKL